jgi:hypothetical protein
MARVVRMASKRSMLACDPTITTFLERHREGLERFVSLR